MLSNKPQHCLTVCLTKLTFVLKTHFCAQNSLVCTKLNSVSQNSILSHKTQFCQLVFDVVAQIWHTHVRRATIGEKQAGEMETAAVCQKFAISALAIYSLRILQRCLMLAILFYECIHAFSHYLFNLTHILCVWALFTFHFSLIFDRPRQFYR
jgi:hypothetical protein